MYLIGTYSDCEPAVLDIGQLQWFYVINQKELESKGGFLIRLSWPMLNLCLFLSQVLLTIDAKFYLMSFRTSHV